MNAIILFLIVSQAQAAQDPYWNIRCWDNPRIVHFLDPNSSEYMTHRRIALERMTIDKISVILPSEGRICNSDSTRAVVLSRQPGNAFEIRIFNEKPFLVRVRMKDIRAVEPPIWINEHMLYARIWTGRVAGVDLYWDSDNERTALIVPFIDASVALEQSREACAKDTAHANPRCDTSRCIRLK